MRIAVIGSGISGNAAAWALSRRHDVTIYEKQRSPGGHAATVDIDYDGAPIAVDTGFIVYNEDNYPLLTRLFDQLGVETRTSDMSFSVSLDNGRFEWSGRTLNSVFAQRRNLFSPGFLLMLGDIFRFNALARRDLQAGALCGLSFGDYIARRRFSARLRDEYLVPLTAAIWSTPTARMLEFPAESLIRFLDNHRLIHISRPLWRTVAGGSRNYVDKLMADFDGELRTGIAATSITRENGKVYVADDTGDRRVYDALVMASHSDQALKMLADPSAEERAVLSSICYRPNRVWLHRDAGLMPRRADAWASWNYLGSRYADGHRDISVTYCLNMLQNIDPARPLFITLNPPVPPRAELTFADYVYDHPQFDAAAIAAQARLPALQGVRNTWYCGAWTRYGFHEDGLASGLEAARHLGATPNWSVAGGRKAAMAPVLTVAT